jgi:hypothetical protein
LVGYAELREKYRPPPIMVMPSGPDDGGGKEIFVTGIPLNGTPSSRMDRHIHRAGHRHVPNAEPHCQQ